MKCKAESWLSMTTSESATTWEEWTVVAIGVEALTSPSSRNTPCSRSANPAPFPVRPPDRVTATQPTIQKSSLGMSSNPIGSPCCMNPCAQADRDLRRIGIALDDASAPPFVKLAEPLGGDIRANEIRDAVENRADVDLGLDQFAPYAPAYGGLCATAPGPSRIATPVHFASSGQCCDWRAHNAVLLKSPSDAQRKIFAPRGSDDLHADRKLLAL